MKDLRVLNAILRKMAKENDFDIENVYLNNVFKYVETIDFNKPDADFCKTNYKGINYKVMYLDGCFNPFILKDV
jgi:hypothetical protein